MPTVSTRWAESALTAIREIGKNKPDERGRIGPPMVARSLALLHTAIYDAWAVYDAVAMPSLLRLPRQAAATDAFRRQAMSQAAYKVLADQFPTEEATFRTTLSTFAGATPSVSVDATTPEGVGNLAAKAVLAMAHADGSNQLGDLAPGSAPYADYTGYTSVNPPMMVTNAAVAADIARPDRWQSLAYADKDGVIRTPGFIGPQWERVRPFALTHAAQFRPAPPVSLLSQDFVDQAQYVIQTQMNLTTEQKVIAEYWADGPSSELPPGHWELFAIFVSKRDNHDLHDDAKLFFALANAIHDAAIATWEAKRFYDYVRPVTAIRHLMRGRKLKGWNGSAIVTLSGEAWQPYQVPTFPTPPFAEFTSGHSGFSMAGAEVLRRFTGSDVFGDEHKQDKELAVEPTLVEAKDVTLKWSTFTEAALQAGESRLYGGIHFYEGNVAGLELGRKVGAQAFDKASRLWSGLGG